MSRMQKVAAAFAALIIAAPLGAPLAAQAANTDGAGQNATAQVSVPVAAIAVTDVAAPQTAAPAALAPATGPTQRAATVGVRPSVAAPVVLDGEKPAPTPDSVGHNPAMMIVGGAALIVGAVIGGRSGTIVMIAGGIIGLVGLWNYLQ